MCISTANECLCSIKRPLMGSKIINGVNVELSQSVQWVAKINDRHGM